MCVDLHPCMPPPRKKALERKYMSLLGRPMCANCQTCQDFIEQRAWW